MLQQPILSGRIGKWAYALIKYDLAYEPLKSMKGQVIADFIVGHSIDQNNDNLISLTCNQGNYISMARLVRMGKV